MMKKIIIGGCPRSGTGALAGLLTRDGRAIVTQEEGLNAWKKPFEKRSTAAKDKLIYVGDKMPEGYLSDAASLYKQFPNGKFIFTNRNGYGVVASYARRPLRKRKLEDITEKSLIKLIKFGETVWRRNLKKLRNLHNILPEDRYILLNYEDNCSDTAGMLTKLGEFLEYDGPVKNQMIQYKDTGKRGPFYRPVHHDWVKGIEFWEEIILSTVSDEFKRLTGEYENIYRRRS